MATLGALANIITSNVRSLEAAYTENSASFPCLDDPFNLTPLDFDPALAQSKALIVAAAAQLIATVKSPSETLQDYSLSMYLTACLGFIVDNNIPNIINEGGSRGVHVKDISARSGIDPSYIARILRFLATRHVFREVAPDIFANNRISSVACKTKTLKEIEADPESSFDNAPLAGLLSHFADEGLTSSARLSTFVRNPEQAYSAFNLAFETNAKLFEWFDAPQNQWRAKRFAAAVKGGSERWPPEIFIEVCRQTSKENDIVVDVGGNVGSCTLHLYKANPKLKYIVQDLPSMIASAESFWKEHAPEALLSSNVTLQVQDFFKPQEIKGAAVYFLRLVIHDWPLKEAQAILKNLRSAANESSKLVIFDFVGQHICETVDSSAATDPLLARLGAAAGGFGTAIDIHMMSLLNGCHRTEEEYRYLGLSTGWKLESVILGDLPSLTFTTL